MPERQLTIQQKRYLKFAHLFFAALWGGGATTMVLLFCLFHPSTAHEQITVSKILFYIDYLALMGFCIFIAHYSTKIIRKIKKKTKES